jgi:hypothetical protein
MSIKIRKPKTIKGLTDIISSLEKNIDTIWRGQQDSKWIIETSLNRFYPLSGHGDPTLDHNVDKFIAGHAKIQNVLFDPNDRLSWLEYGQHHGLPTPCLDFSYSPYIGLFFAFSGLTKLKENGYCALFALNIRTLASHYANNYCKLSKPDEWYEYFINFLNPPKDVVQNTYPKPINIPGVKINDFFPVSGLYPFDKLQFFPFPKASNERMLRQQGCFIYDTLQYGSKIHNLEELIEGIPVSDEDDGPTLQKIVIPLKLASEVFKIIEKMNINASLLYMNSTGVAEDVKNTYFYNPRTMMVRK